MKPMRHRAARLVVFAALTLGAAAGIAYATIPEANNVIHGCYQSTTGHLRVVDPAATSKPMQGCNRDETPLDWNQQGQKGDAGPAGAPGVAGTPGEDGLSVTPSALAS